MLTQICNLAKIPGNVAGIASRVLDSRTSKKVASFCWQRLKLVPKRIYPLWIPKAVHNAFTCTLIHVHVKASSN